MSPAKTTDGEAEEGPPPRTGLALLFETTVRQVPGFVGSHLDDAKFKSVLDTVEGFERRLKLTASTTQGGTSTYAHDSTSELTDPKVLPWALAGVLGHYLARFRDLSRVDVMLFTAQFGKRAARIIDSKVATAAAARAAENKK